MQSISIHIGLNHLDPQRYRGWRGELAACEADAMAMAALAEAQGIATRVLLTADATHARVMAELARAASSLQTGDYLLLTFAGHGASLADIPMLDAPASAANGHADDAGDESDGRDEAWCLHDGFVLDDEIHGWLCKLAAGVRVCVVSDSCYSGTVTRHGQRVERSPRRRSSAARTDEPADARERRMPPRVSRALYRRDFSTTYLPRRLAVATSRTVQPGAHVVLLAACQDNQTAMEGKGHGRFTEQLLTTWNGGHYAGSHGQFIEQIRAAMPRRQEPRMSVTGEPSTAFVNSRPFTAAP